MGGPLVKAFLAYFKGGFGPDHGLHVDESREFIGSFDVTVATDDDSVQVIVYEDGGTLKVSVRHSPATKVFVREVRP
jgi:hypothetical protein